MFLFDIIKISGKDLERPCTRANASRGEETVMEKEKKIKQKIVTGTAATVTAASLLVNNVVSDPETLLKPREENKTDPSHVATVDTLEHRSYILETDQYEPLTLREQIRIRIQKLPLPVRALILLPLWGIGELINVLVTALIASPVGRFLMLLLLEIGLILGLFALVWKLLFPDIPLKKVFSRKNVPWLFGGALILSAADFLLGYYLENWKLWRIVLMAVLGLGVLALLWWRLFRNAPEPERRKKRVELTIE